MYVSLPSALTDRLQHEGLAIVGESSMIVWNDTFIPYTSGKIGNYKIQSDVLQEFGNARLYKQAVNLMQTLYEYVEAQGTSPTTVITGGETKDWIFSAPVAEQMRIPHVSLHKSGHMIGKSLEHATVTH